MNGCDCGAICHLCSKRSTPPKPYYQDLTAGLTIYHGDCLEILPTITADLVLTDPPYNVGLDYSEGDNRNDYPAYCRSWFDKCPRPLVLTPGMVNLAMWMTLQPPNWTCAWIKPNQCSPSALRGFNTWEPILVYGKLTKRVGQDSWITPIGQQSDVGDHPCPKYLPFWIKLLAAISEESQTILDPFLGSGTTLRAAKELKRKAIGIEREERYCEIAANRLRTQFLF